MTTADSWESCPHCEHFIDWHQGANGRYRCFKCGCTIDRHLALLSDPPVNGSIPESPATCIGPGPDAERGGR